MLALRFDEGFRSLCPPLAAEERAKLKASILEEGVRDAVVYWDNGEENPPILDGYNRVDICAEIGRTFPTRGMKFGSRLDVECWVLRNQLGRRNLNDVQRARVLKHLVDTISRAKTNGISHATRNRDITVMSLDGACVNGTSRGDRRLTAAVAREAGVSECTVSRGLATDAALRELEARAPAIAKEALAGAINGKHVVELAKLSADELKPLCGLKGRELKKNVHLLLHGRCLLRPLGEEFHDVREAIAKCAKLVARCKWAHSRAEGHWCVIKDCLDKISWEIREWSKEAVEENDP
jgi:hypothetical protein